jgi:hypothetical protein
LALTTRDNRWPRLYGEGVVEPLGNDGGTSPPFEPGEVRAFVIQVWDADARAVLAERVARGTARIAGARSCPVRAFSVRVSGRQIRRVTFSVDGRRIGSVTRPDRLGRFEARIDPRRYRAGGHRVRARVEFRRGAGSARTLRTSFRICARPAAQVQPKFTG